MSKKEEEFFTANQQLAFKLRNLYLENRSKFEDLEPYLSIGIHINRKDNLDIVYANDRLICKGPELVSLKKFGGSYLKEISCPKLLNININKANHFKLKGDFNEVSSFFQNLKVNNTMSFMFSNKVHLDNESYFNIGNFVDDIGALGKLVESILKQLEKNNIGWQQFQSLTKQEKVVLNLVSSGLANKEIADQLCVSVHTIQTHRKNIYRKTNTNNIADLVHFNNALKLFEI